MMLPLPFALQVLLPPLGGLTAQLVDFRKIAI